MSVLTLPFDRALTLSVSYSTSLQIQTQSFSIFSCITSSLWLHQSLIISLHYHLSFHQTTLSWDTDSTLNLSTHFLMLFLYPMIRCPSMRLNWLHETLIQARLLIRFSHLPFIGPQLFPSIMIPLFDLNPIPPSNPIPVKSELVFSWITFLGGLNWNFDFPDKFEVRSVFPEILQNISSSFLHPLVALWLMSRILFRLEITKSPFWQSWLENVNCSNGLLIYPWFAQTFQDTSNERKCTVYIQYLCPIWPDVGKFIMS